MAAHSGSPDVDSDSRNASSASRLSTAHDHDDHASTASSSSSTSDSTSATVSSGGPESYVCKVDTSPMYECYMCNASQCHEWCYPIEIAAGSCGSYLCIYCPRRTCHGHCIYKRVADGTPGARKAPPSPTPVVNPDSAASAAPLSVNNPPTATHEQATDIELPPTAPSRSRSLPRLVLIISTIAIAGVAVGVIALGRNRSRAPK